MHIGGLQKLTLLDYPGRMACTVFTPGCNFRCPFCHNASLVLPTGAEPTLDEAELWRFLERRRGVLEGVAVTGGEPLLQADVRAFLARLKDMGFLVKLDTNGSFPDKLAELIGAGLVDRVAMDVKNSPAFYGMTVGLESFDMGAVTASRDILLSGAVEYEFRTTCVRGLHTAESIAAAAEWIQGAREYYLQQYKDSGDILDAGGLGAFDEREMRVLADAAVQYVPTVKIRGV